MELHVTKGIVKLWSLPPATVIKCRCAGAEGIITSRDQTLSCNHISHVCLLRDMADARQLLIKLIIRYPTKWESEQKWVNEWQFVALNDEVPNHLTPEPFARGPKPTSNFFER